MRRTAAALSAALLIAAPATAQLPAPVEHVQSADEVVTQDAGEYARHYGVTLVEAARRLRAQDESAAVTDRLQASYADRLAGIAIEHVPAYRIVVLLTGDEPVPDAVFTAAGLDVPIVFHTGATATRAQVLDAIDRHQAEIRSELTVPPGMGADPRTGALLVMIGSADAETEDIDALQERFAGLTGVPVRIGVLGRSDADLELAGGARVEGVDPADRRRYACTAGFAVTDGVRTGIVTAAHCPDVLVYRNPDGGTVPLDFVGQWGARDQDVQVNLPPMPPAPLFYADTARTVLRPVTSWRNRMSTRAGDFVCHRGERTGYSCAEIVTIDYAPPGDLCAGPCTPTWVAVRGPSSKAGDSGGPVFDGTIALGIVKGASYGPDGTAALYYYMSTDYLPAGWTVLTTTSSPPADVVQPATSLPPAP